MRNFEIGKTYYYTMCGLELANYTCTKRTEKFVWFKPDIGRTFRLKIRAYQNFEYVRIHPSSTFPVLSCLTEKD